MYVYYFFPSLSSSSLNFFLFSYNFFSFPLLFLVLNFLSQLLFFFFSFLFNLPCFFHIFLRFSLKIRLGVCMFTRYDGEWRDMPEVDGWINLYKHIFNREKNQRDIYIIYSFILKIIKFTFIFNLFHFLVLKIYSIMLLFYFQL